MHHPVANFILSHLRKGSHPPPVPCRQAPSRFFFSSSFFRDLPHVIGNEQNSHCLGCINPAAPLNCSYSVWYHLQLRRTTPKKNNKRAKEEEGARRERGMRRGVRKAIPRGGPRGLHLPKGARMSPLKKKRKKKRMKQAKKGDGKRSAAFPQKSAGVGKSV